MHLDITTGKDSFRATHGSPRRSVAVQAFVRVKDDWEGNTVIPLFAAYQKKLPGFRDNSLLASIPATTKFQANIAGNWYNTRYEVRTGTEILLEYRSRKTSGFAEEVEYALLQADEVAPLWQLRLDLPAHEHSAVPYVFFEGRFTVVSDDDALSPQAIQVWRDFFDLEDDIHVSDMMDINHMDAQVWRYILMERGAVKAKPRVIAEKTAKGKTRYRVRRGRNISLK